VFSSAITGKHPGFIKEAGMEQNKLVLKNLSEILAALQLKDPNNLVLLDANRLDQVCAAGVGIGPRLVAGFPADTNCLFYNLGSSAGTGTIARVLAQSCPPAQSIKLVFLNGGNLKVQETTLADLGSKQGGELPIAVFLPARESDLSFETFQQVVARLRAPDGCPWDREQTYLSLRPHLLEEAYETLEAIDQADPESLHRLKQCQPSRDHVQLLETTVLNLSSSSRDATERHQHLLCMLSSQLFPHLQ